MGMGRIGEVTRRTWQLAHVMKRASGEATRERQRAHPALPRQADDQPGADARDRARGRLARARQARRRRPLAAGVLRREAAARAQGGFGAWAPLGSGSGSTRIGEPLVYGACSAASAPRRRSWPASSRAAPAPSGSRERWPGRVGDRARRADACARRTSSATARRPSVRVDPEAERVFVDGEPVELEPATELPLNRPTSSPDRARRRSFQPLTGSSKRRNSRCALTAGRSSCSIAAYHVVRAASTSPYFASMSKRFAPVGPRPPGRRRTPGTGRHDHAVAVRDRVERRRPHAPRGRASP